MTQLDDLVVGTVALSGGELVGRIRLQKIIYLLDQLGMNSGALFEYHHYGPYSEAISDAVTDAKFWKKIEERVNFRAIDGAPYSSFKTESPVPNILGDLQAEEAKRFLDKFASYKSTVLELAATIHWLAFVEKVPDWRAEVERRKADKIGNGRVDIAFNLLKEIGLAPAS